VKERLNQFHIAILIYMIQSGVMFFSLPRLLAENFGTNGWIAILICSAAVTLNIFFISLVYRAGNGRSVFNILEQSIHRAFLNPIYLMLAALWAMLGCMVLKQYILLFQMVAFPTTNPMIFKLLCDFLVFQLVVQGIYNITKAATVFFHITFWMILLVIFHFHEFRAIRLTTFIFQEGTHLAQNWMEVYSAFVGYELCLFFFPYVAQKTKFFAAVYWGNALVTMVYLITSVVCFGFFSFKQVSNLMYPVMDLLAYIELPFVERIENLLFTFFIFKILITTVLYSWVALETTQRVFPKIKNKVLSLIIIISTYSVSFIPEILREVEIWLRRLGYIQIGVSYLFPLVLLLLLWLQQKKVRKE
jgi:spore germination protein (amino acid permease)